MKKKKNCQQKRRFTDLCTALKVRKRNKISKRNNPSLLAISSNDFVIFTSLEKRKQAEGNEWTGLLYLGCVYLRGNRKLKSFSSYFVAVIFLRKWFWSSHQHLKDFPVLRMKAEIC